MDGDRVGIANAITVRETEGDGPIEEVEFHAVNEDGTTAIVYHVPVIAVAQARYEDIPECRRPTKSLGNALGYK
jgi:hypothetical protein